MPSRIVVTRGSILEGSDAWLTARVLTADDTALVTGDITGTITVKVFDVTSGGEGRRPDQSIFTKTDIAVAGTVLNAYATTYWAGKDSTGYNFVYPLRYDTAGTTGPYLRGGHTYLVEFSMDTTAATDFGTTRIHFRLYVEPLMGV